MSTFSQEFLHSSQKLFAEINPQDVEAMVEALREVREKGGRLFILGNGGSAGHASHATNDFRKLCGIEAYAPTDNVSELTARINDEGWDSCFAEYLKVSRLNKNDGLLVFSVGGGNKEKNISNNIVLAMDLAVSVGATVLGIVGKDGGYTKEVSKACVVIPTLSPSLVTPLTEGACAMVWHLIVSHPRLQTKMGKWESVSLRPNASSTPSTP